MNTPTILLGAFDRHNFGDLLFPHIAAALLPGRRLIFAGLAERDLRPFGGHRTHALARLAAEFGNAPVRLIHVGGEILTCEAWHAALMLQPADAVPALVARLDALAEKTRQVEAHLDAAECDAEHLLALRFRDAIANAPLRAMAEVAPLIRRDVAIDLEASYTELGVRSFYKGTFHRRTVAGSEFTWQKMFRVEEGDLIFSNIMAWEQAIALAKSEDQGCVGNHRMLTCVADRTKAVPGFLAYYFRTEEGFAKVYAASPGTAARNRTLVATNLEAIRVPVPPLPVQQSFDRLQAEVAALRAQHAELRAANAALLPATLERVFAGGD